MRNGIGWRLLPAFVLLGSGAARAGNSLSDEMTQLTTEAAKQYVAPVVSGLGADLNAGWYHRAPQPVKFGFTFEAGTIAMGSLLGNGPQTFDVQGSFRFDTSESRSLLNQVDFSSIPASQQQAVRDSLANHLATVDNTVRFYGPTVIGSRNDSVRVVYNGRNLATGLSSPNDSIAIPTDTLVLPVVGILNKIKNYPLPLLAPQIGIGTVFGTNLTLRWLPTFDIPDVGSLNFFGFGIQHNPEVWLGNKLPIDFCLGYFYQHLQVGELFDANTSAYGIDVSKTLGGRLFNLTPYAGFQYETCTMTFHYDLNVNTPSGEQTENIRFDLAGDNDTRLTLGLGMHLLVFNLNADYNFAKYPSLSAGLMIGI